MQPQPLFSLGPASGRSHPELPEVPLSYTPSLRTSVKVFLESLSVLLIHGKHSLWESVLTVAPQKT